MQFDYGSWKIVKELGAGSFGRVFEIEQVDALGFKSRAALKIIKIPQNQNDIDTIRSTGMDDASITKYYQSIATDSIAEIALMSKMQGNTNIVNYQAHTVRKHADGFGWDIYIQMELLTSLTKLLVKRSLSRIEVINLGIDICRALERCQMHHIIHRDIKPGNIFISEQGDFKLGDFGIARIQQRVGTEMSRKGTYNFMAPEIFYGRHYDGRVDIYSLGLVMYQLLNDNRAPFLPVSPLPITEQDQENALKHRMSGEMLPYPRYAQDELGRIILKACQYSPLERYLTPTQMRVALERLQKEKTTREHRTTDIGLDSTIPDISSKNESFENSTTSNENHQNSEQETLKDKTNILFPEAKAREKRPVVEHKHNIEKPIPEHRNKNSNPPKASHYIKKGLIAGLSIVIVTVLAIAFYIGWPMLYTDSHTETSVKLSQNIIKPQDMSWNIDKNGTLTISGNGPMDNYSSDDPAPWHDKTSEILSISIEDGVTAIGNYAFANCNLTQNVKMEDSVTSIGECAFIECQSLTNIELSANITDIKDRAFWICNKLENVQLPNALETIGASAFYGCSLLEAILIPENVSKIGSAAFWGCENLHTIQVSSDNEHYTERNGVLFNKKKTILYVYPPGRTDMLYQIPEGVNVIDCFAFSSCPYLRECLLPDSITVIGIRAFYYSGIQSITIPYQVNTIATEAFMECSNLSNVCFAGDLPSIAKDAFTNTTTVFQAHVDDLQKYKDENYGGEITWESNP